MERGNMERGNMEQDNMEQGKAPPPGRRAGSKFEWSGTKFWW
jgi:hypothetical protein